MNRNARCEDIRCTGFDQMQRPQRLPARLAGMAAGGFAGSGPLGGSANSRTLGKGKARTFGRLTSGIYRVSRG